MKPIQRAPSPLTPVQKSLKRRVRGAKLLQVAAISWLSLGAMAIFTNDAEEPRVSYTRDVRPILAAHCYTCHGPDQNTREADLRLDTAEGLAADLGGYLVTLAGNPKESELYLRANASDEDERMPPADAGPRLSSVELDVLRRWIEEGAQWEPHWAFAPLSGAVPPAQPSTAEALHPIDRFVRAKLNETNLTPAAEADRRTLIRRVSLDLIGMLPSQQELTEFLGDQESGAYERVVERLLASPHHAERWARHWLDLARYADSHGFTIDGARSMWPYRDWVLKAIQADMPFDQFTIEQLAGDLLPEPSNAQLVATGFHRNTQINQEGGAKDEENRINAVIDRVDTTASVWLGTTVGCARCHDHKFDPISQRDYYSLFAFFNHTEDGGVSTGPTVQVTEKGSEAELLAFESERTKLRAELAARELQARAGWDVWTPKSARGSNGPELQLQANHAIRSIGHGPQTSVYVLEGQAPATGIRALRFEALPHLNLRGHGPGRAAQGNFVLERVRLFARNTEEQEAGEFRELSFASATADYSQGVGPEGGTHFPVAGAIDDEPKTGWAISPRFGEPHVSHFQLEHALPAGNWELRLELHQNYGSGHVLGNFRIAFDLPKVKPQGAQVPEAWKAAWQAVVKQASERPSLPTSLVMKERLKPRETRLFKRGNFLDPGELVEAGFPQSMNHFAKQAVPTNRLDLANWLVDPQNALVQRVTVNRLWQRFFGIGLVESSADFGSRGAEASHPDLLDWLAAEWVTQKFSMKAMQRLIVTSATYRQSSRIQTGAAALDPRNRLLSRQSRLRMDAESIRDSALRASGLLDASLGGPPVQPPQPAGVFDFTQSKKAWKADQDGNRYRRSLYTRIWRSSTYPFLTTFDAPVPNVTCTKRGNSSTPLQALTLANDPMMLELAAGLGHRVREESPEDAARLRQAFELCLSRLPSAPEFELLGAHLSAQRDRHTQAGLAEPEVEERAWTAVARVLFNLDEFITRE